MNIKEHCYVFNYNTGEIWHVDVKNYINIPLDKYGNVDWEAVLEEQGLDLDELEYLIVDKPLCIKEWFS